MKSSTMPQKKQIRISEIIIPKYMPLFNDSRHKHIILTSGRAGTKSSYAGIKANYQIVSDTAGSVVVLRKRHNKLRKTVYKEMIRGINRLQISKSKFIIGKSPMEIRYKKYNTTIYFSGSDGIDDTKGIIDEDKPIKLVVLDELTEFFDDGEGEEELVNIEATFVRGNKSGFQMIYLYNPPKNPNAPINLWCKKMEQRPDCIHIHTDYRDVPVDWLGEDLLESARMMEQTDPKMYRWTWLGEPIGVDELIYYMYCEKNRYKPEGDRYRIIGIGVDYGQQNATTFQPFGLNLDRKRIEGLKEYYHSGRETGKQRSPSIYAKAFIVLTEELHETYKCSIFYAYIDPSAAGLAEEIRRQARNCDYQVIVKNAENDVKVGIQRTQKCFSYSVLTISPMQPKLDWELGLYEYDKKSIERGKEEPVKENDHACDALRYCVMGLWTKIKYFLPQADREEGERH